METNEITGQTQPGQNTQAEQLRPLTLTVPATSEPEPTAETMEPVPNDTPPMPEPPATETPRLYDPGVVARIAQCLSELLDPAYILLFGSMAGGTPHSDALSYDLLIATHDTPQYNWLDVRRYLKMKMPGAGHGAPYLNIYMYAANYVVSQSSPLFYLARKEGVLLYCSDRHKFKRPKRPYPFSEAACNAKHYYTTFMSLGDQFLEQAGTALTENKIRQAAFATAQAAVYFFQVLFRGYTRDVMILHERTRTLSAELFLLFESDSFTPIHTLPCLRRFIINARYDSSFFIHVTELEQHLDRVERMQSIVEKVCIPEPPSLFPCRLSGHAELVADLGLQCAHVPPDLVVRDFGVDLRRGNVLVP